MERFFNTAGPMIPEDHYYIDSLTRIDWEDIQRLIRDKRYFVMHAPRQTGKTSALLAMMRALNKEGRYACAYANIEIAQTARTEDRGIPAVCSAISKSVAMYLQKPDLKQWFPGSRTALTASAKTTSNMLKTLKRFPKGQENIQHVCQPSPHLYQTFQFFIRILPCSG